MLYFSGIQPTGKLHIGNYLGAIKNWVGLQQPHTSNIYCIVDYHALTDKMRVDHTLHFPTNTKQDSITLAATLIASGIDTNKSIFFLQSQVPQHAELQWLLSCVAPQNWLNKMTQYKDKKSSSSTLGLFTYPVLMAADIILYQATHVPVGQDQKQHVELTVDYVERLNSLFNLNLVLPEYMESRAPRIMNLRDGKKKMSKSDPNDFNRINIFDSPELIFDKIKKAKTDSIEEIKYNIEERPEMSNLLTIYGSFADLEIEQVEKLYQNKSKVEFKEDLANLISNKIHPIHLKAQDLLEYPEQIENILFEGSVRARSLAKQNIKQIKKGMGLLV